MEVRLNSSMVPEEYKKTAKEVFLAKNNEKTFQYQDKLPSLPVPSLEQTLNKYLDSVAPHLNDAEYRETEFVVRQFGSGIGKELHGKLVEKAKSERNWLEKWWEKVAYLDGRCSTAPSINFSGPAPFHHHYWPPADGTQIERTAILAHHTLNFWHMLRTEDHLPHKKGKEPLCMNQFHRVFNTYKVPKPVTDELKFYFKTEREGPCPTNIIILRKGHVFTFDAVDKFGVPLMAPEIQVQMQRIADICDALPQGPGLAACTAHDRTSWAKLREHLLELHQDNHEYIDILQGAIGCFVFEDYPTTGDTENFHSGLCGDATNRWFDKSVSLISYSNGTFSSNCDHAPFDGMALVFFMLYADLNVFHDKGKWTGTKEIRPQPQPKRLDFHLDQFMLEGIEEARRSFKAQTDNIDSFCPVFDKFGKNELKRLKFHPDTFVQLALQFAYYRMMGKPGCCYETATTRQYWHARTETVRSCTPEAIEWSKAMLNPSSSSARRYQLLKSAEEKHNRMMSECQNAQGCDRHLLGLRLIAAENNIPDPLIYKDKAWTKSGGDGNFILSTSMTGYSTILGGVSPMCKNGYGTFYRVPSSYINMVLTCFKSDEETDVHKFYESITKSMDEMKELIEKNLPQSGQAAKL
ncbi:peroxisomal carnitine O-octanoyltransferase-like isoform X2 [Lineus longissimus]